MSNIFHFWFVVDAIIWFCLSFQSVRAEDDDEFVVLQKPIGEIRRAFNEMRGRHSEMFVNDSKRRGTICLPSDSKDDMTEETEGTEEDSDYV